MDNWPDREIDLFPFLVSMISVAMGYGLRDRCLLPAAFPDVELGLSE